MGRIQRRRLERQKTANDCSSREDNFISALYKYLNSLGWRNETQISVRNFSATGRGLCTKSQQHKEGDLLIRLPIKCLITIATLENDARFKMHFNSDKFNKDQCIPFQCLMALYLLHEKHLAEGSKLHAYLQSIPKQFSMPYFCSLTELQCLPEAILEKTVAQNRKIRESYNVLQAVLAAEHCLCCGQKYLKEIFAFDAFKWAYFAVNSRSVFVDSRLFKPNKCDFQTLLSDDTNLALAPFLDLFNHSDDVATSAELCRNAAKEYEFTITLISAPKCIQKYEELFISYGSLSNFKLLTDYGFILAKNMHDYFEFSLLDIENFIRQEKTFSERTFHSNKFKFIRDHNLHDQMFVHLSDGTSHNLHVVLHLIFKEDSHFVNVLSQVAFGAATQLQNVALELQLLIAFKIAELQCFVNDLKKLPQLSESGLVSLAYMQECIRYLTEYKKLLVDE